ncbi:uncharacterized protein LOC121306114 isoform X1 [Polyodon spathula]|uniref:uncharacterized protein LOC121306114 isoform X1 n=1 Tax=Polyodon spathula TaxID=7913 RepID=UPI001B7ED7C4|nr:uncharacterized protein LOC121306114 isoform X1 [Polyodon spathula]
MKDKGKEQLTHEGKLVLCTEKVKVYPEIKRRQLSQDRGNGSTSIVLSLFLVPGRKLKSLYFVLVLEAVQIMIAIVTIGCGVILMLSPPSLVMITRIPFGTSLMFLFSGALSIAVERFRKVLQVCVCINIVSFIYAGIGIILYSVDLSFWNSYTTSTALNLTTAEIKGLMCMLAVLELCITAALLKSRLATTPTSPEND